DEEADEEGGGQASHPGGAAAADGAFEVSLGHVAGGPLADGSLDGGGEFAFAQVEPVDDAVLGAGDDLLHLASGVVGIEPARQRQDQGERQVKCGNEKVAGEGELAEERGQLQGTIDDGHDQGKAEGDGTKAEQSSSYVEAADAVACPGETGLDEGVVLAG